MGADTYERPARSQPARAGAATYENPRPLAIPEDPSRGVSDVLKTGAIATGAGAGIGAGAYMLRGLLRKAFPGMMPTTSALKRLDATIKRSDSSANLKGMFSDYMRHVSETDKPLSFADYLAQQPGHQNSVALVKELVAGSGNVPKIEEKLGDRAAGQKKRVLDDIASALNVNPQSVVMGKDDLIAARKSTAQPLYDKAFADSDPIRDTRFFSLFEAPAARTALRNAVRNAENSLKPIQVRSAASEGRKDWWKRASEKDIPEGLFLDDEAVAGLRRYIAPNLSNADKIQQDIYAQMKAAMKTDPVTGYEKHTPASSALNDLHKQFMQTMYDTAPNEHYRAARTAYAGDSKILGAHQIGSELIKMNPDEVRKAVKGMTDAEREAVASGFYGSLNDMNQQKFLRELVARPERYPERREVLSAVFRDPVKLDQFLNNLKGEEAMADSFAHFGNSPPSKDTAPRLPWARVTDSVSNPVQMKIGITESLKDLVGWPSTRASRAGTDVLFREPKFYPRSVGHPDWETINRTPLSAGEIARQGGRWTGAGALGGLGTYAGEEAVSALPDRDRPRSPLEMGLAP